MANITEYLRQIQALTNKNLEMLRAINESFNTKKSYLSVSVDDVQYKIPSYLALENKITDLQEAFYNLVNAPKTGEAHFNFDGNTQEIQVKTWTTTPESVRPALVKYFDVKNNSWFKDLLNPVPFVKFDLSSIADDIKKVNVKKVVLKSQNAISTVGEVYDDGNPSCEVDYQLIVDSLSQLEENYDYEQYDKVYDLPIRDNSRIGKWTIKSIDENYTDDNFDEFYTITLNEELKTLDDKGVEKYLQLGDYVLCNEDKVKLQIVSEPKIEAKQIKVKVLYGGYTNLVTAASGEAGLSTLTYYSINDTYNYKYIEIPLEEDQYIFIFVDTINDLNVKSLLKSGLLINTNKLSLLNSENETSFPDYYSNVSNIGDKLESITTMFNNGLNVYTQEQYEIIKSFQPSTDYLTSAVKQINTHLDNSSTVKSIRSLYAQKQSNKTKIKAVQSEISRINELINNIDFNDTTGIREVYVQQLQDKQSEYQNLQDTIKSLTTEIADEANNSVTPIENAKYRIRGFYNLDKIYTEINEKIDSKQKPINPIKINVLYRYRNNEGTTGNAMSISDNQLFSDWNIMPSEFNKKVAKTEDFAEGEKFGYVFNYLPTNMEENEPSFNQIDIPITQGEKVDIKIGVQFDLGYPFISVESAYSDVVTIDFPEELQKDVEILDIINENNDEVKQHAFDNILTKYGVQEHVGNKVQDNDTTFWHSADNITSGFYTSEQRVISLKEKLNEMNNTLTEVHDEVFGTNTNDLTVVLSNNVHSVILNDNDENIFNAQDYISNTNITTNIVDSSEQNISLSIDYTSSPSTEENKYQCLEIYCGTETVADQLMNIYTSGRIITINEGTPIKAHNGKYYSIKDVKIVSCEKKPNQAGIYRLSIVLDTDLNWKDGAQTYTDYATYEVILKDITNKYDRITLQLQNNSNNSMKIYPLFFGEKDDELKYGNEQYMSSKYFTAKSGGIGIYTKQLDTCVYQKYNQLLYFRLFDPYVTSFDGNERLWFYTNINSNTSETISSSTTHSSTDYSSVDDTNIKYDMSNTYYAVWSFKVDKSSENYAAHSTNLGTKIFNTGCIYNIVVFEIKNKSHNLYKWYAGNDINSLTDYTDKLYDLEGTKVSVGEVVLFNTDFFNTGYTLYLINKSQADKVYVSYPATFEVEENKPIVDLSIANLKEYTNTPANFTNINDAIIISYGKIETIYNTVYDVDDKLSYNKGEQYSVSNFSKLSSNTKFAFLYPYVNSMSDIQLKSGSSRYYTLKSGESINLGLMLEYFLSAKSGNNSISKTIAFDVRTSLYSEPHLYIVKVKANYETQKQFEDTATNRYNAIVTN